MNKQQIDCFLTAAKTGSITKASDEMFLSPQVVSQHILNLEQELGIVLFVRNKYGVSLTKDGNDFQEYALKWNRLYEETRRKIGDYYSGIAASFQIGISEYIDILGEISGGLASFRSAHPDITMSGKQYKNKHLLEEVENGHLDVAILNEMQIITGSDFDYCPIAREDLRFYYSGNREQVPHISTSYGVWSKNDWEEVSRRMSSFLGYHFNRHYEAVNFRSAVLNLRNLPCSVICDARFGYLPKNSGINSMPIKVESYLCCLWYKKNENPLISEFINHMTAFYQ